jgi:hypothetical protein
VKLIGHQFWFFNGGIVKEGRSGDRREEHGGQEKEKKKSEKKTRNVTLSYWRS